jgi:DNA-binding PadR family transcriptional regulator
VILGVLAIGGDLSGYEIRQWIVQAVGFFWSESYGQLYPELRRLTKDGLIKALPGGGKGARAIQRYRILKAGQAKLRTWLQKQPQAERPRNETVLKLFFGAVAGPETARKALRDFAASMTARVAALEQAECLVLAEDRTSPNFVYSLITLLGGPHVLAARLAWANDAQALLDAHEKGGNEAVAKAYKRLRPRSRGTPGRNSEGDVK